jgi:hypothetical protein
LRSSRYALKYTIWMVLADVRPETIRVRTGVLVVTNARVYCTPRAANRLSAPMTISGREPFQLVHGAITLFGAV